MEKDSRSFRNRWIQRCAEMGNAYVKKRQLERHALPTRQSATSQVLFRLYV